MTIKLDTEFWAFLLAAQAFICGLAFAGHEWVRLGLAGAIGLFCLIQVIRTADKERRKSR